MKSKKILFTSHTANFQKFNRPFMRMLSEQGYEVHYASMGEEEILDCDKSFVVPFTRSPFGISNIAAYKQLKEIIDREHYDIIHTHTPMGSVVTRLAARASRKKGTRVIYTAHGFHFFKGAPLLNWLIYYPVERYMARHTDTLITINKEDYERAKTQFKTNVRYVPGVGIDPKKFDIRLSKKQRKDLRAEFGINENDFVMIYVAELSKRKNQLWLIKALASFLREHPDAHLLLPGADSLDGAAHKLVMKLSLQQQIHLPGYRTDIPSLMKASDIAVSASKQEGLPVNIMEAMYIGKPIVVTDCRGNRDLIADSENGSIVKQGDRQNFTNSVEMAYENKSTGKTTPVTAEERSKGHRVDNIMHKMTAIYTRALENPIRVLHVVTIMNRAGLETMLMNYYRHIDRKAVQFDFLVHRAEKGDYDDEIQRLGGRIHYFDPITIKTMPKYAQKMASFLSNHPEYEIVHSHLDALSALPLNGARLAGVQTRIAHSHNNGFDIDYKLPMRYFMKSLIPRTATHLFACSHEAGRFMFGRYRNITIIRNAIDGTQFEFNQRTRTTVRSELKIEDNFVIGHVGRFTRQKNHTFLIRLFADFKNKIPNSKLVLVGVGETQESAKQLSRILDIEKDVLFLGSRDDVSDVMQAMDFFVLPSLYEGLGIVAIEAQATGLPCLVSERVPNETKLSKHYSALSLKNGHTNWADYIASASRVHARRESINIGDYEIINACESLQKFYTRKQKRTALE